ncbi:hypothetical protein Pstu01_40680 [Stutzerimonas stutzeri]|nr:hypothetical protein Pstu01_40680 [Stutzerimonas stutzeri]
MRSPTLIRVRYPEQNRQALMPVLSGKLPLLLHSAREFAMPIRHCIVHLIEKKPDGTPAVLHARDSELGESQAMENLLADLNESYNAKQGKAWGFFHGESGAYPFSGWLAQYMEGSQDFTAFSRQAVEHLQKLMFWHLENVKYLCYSIQTFRSSGASKAA